MNLHRLPRCLASATLALCLGISVATAQGDPDDVAPDEAPDVAPGGVIAGFYRLVAAAHEAHDACTSILDALDRPKPVDDIWDLLVGTPYNYIWQHSDDGESWTDARTVGEITPRLNAASRLTVDLNNDGTPERVYRDTNMFHGQLFTEMTVEPLTASGQASSDPVIDLEIKDVKPRPPLNITPRDIGGDFYFMDILAVGGRNYVIAADSIRGHGLRQPSALVFTVGPDMQLNPVCHFAATKRIL